MDIQKSGSESVESRVGLMQRIPAEHKLYVAAAIAVLMIVAGAVIAANTEVLNLAMWRAGWWR